MTALGPILVNRDVRHNVFFDIRYVEFDMHLFTRIAPLKLQQGLVQRECVLLVLV